MASEKPDRTSSTQPPQPPSEAVRGVISLLVLIHGLLVFFALSANVSPSILQSTLLDRTRIYTQLLNFELDFTPYQLTHATVNDVDHRIEVLSRDGDENNENDWYVLPDVGWRGGERYKRYQRFGDLAAIFVDQEEFAALLTQGVADNMLHDEGLEPKQIRYRRHLLQDREMIDSGTPEQRDPNSDVYFRTPYAANVLIVGDGQIQLVKKDAAAEVAQPRSPTNGEAPQSNE